MPAEPPVAPSDPSGVDRGSGVGGASPRSADGCATGEGTSRCHPPAERERGASGEPLGAASGAGGEHEHGMRVPRQGRAQPRPRAARPSSRGSRRRHRPVARGRAMHRHLPTPPKPRLRGRSPGLQIDPLPTGRGRETWGNPIHRVSPPPSSGAAAWRGRGGRQRARVGGAARTVELHGSRRLLASRARRHDLGRGGRGSRFRLGFLGRPPGPHLYAASRWPECTGSPSLKEVPWFYLGRTQAKCLVDRRCCTHGRCCACVSCFP